VLLAGVWLEDTCGRLAVVTVDDAPYDGVLLGPWLLRLPTVPVLVLPAVDWLAVAAGL
jgi:hypothetical protein